MHVSKRITVFLHCQQIFRLPVFHSNLDVPSQRSWATCVTCWYCPAKGKTKEKSVWRDKKRALVCCHHLQNHYPYHFSGTMWIGYLAAYIIPSLTLIDAGGIWPHICDPRAFGRVFVVLTGVVGFLMRQNLHHVFLF